MIDRRKRTTIPPHDAAKGGAAMRVWLHVLVVVAVIAVIVGLSLPAT
jgi:hypothetical protein